MKVLPCDLSLGDNLQGFTIMNAGYSWLGLLIDSSFASRFLINRASKIVFANRAAHALFGYSDNELAGKPIDVIFASRKDRELAVPRMPSFSSKMVGDDGEIKGLTKQGEELILRVGTCPINTVGESFLSVTVFDITNYKHKERELLFRARQLEEANKSVSKFAYLVAHNLRTDLIEILSVSSKLKTALAEGRPTEAGDASARVRDLASHACDVVSELLEYSQEALSVLSLQYVDVREEIELVLRDLSPTITEAGFTVQNEVPANLKVKADKPQFERLIASLLSQLMNSSKTKVSPEIIISATPNEQQNGIQLSIDSKRSDNPTGSHAAEFPSVTPAGGLAAAKSICEQHGWSVSSETLPAQGARLKVDIRQARG
ncbi:MAG TPA: PAS domain-containing sensor histidine kinase [Methylocystis sp.]